MHLQDEEKTIVLRKPVSIGKGEGSVAYETLTLREPTAVELEKASRNDTSIGVGITLISLVAGVPRAAVEKIGRRDLMAAINFLEGFTDSGQAAEAAGQN